MLRLDYLFSNWILTWFILYYFKFLILPTPKIALILALFFNLFYLFLLIKGNNNYKEIGVFCLVVLFTKILGLYLMRNDKITYESILFFLILYTIYILYMIINFGNLKNLLNYLKKSFDKPKPGPIALNILKIFQNFKNNI